MPNHFRTRRTARLCILLLWAGCILAIAGVVVQNRYSPGTTTVETSLFASADARQQPAGQWELKHRYPAGAANTLLNAGDNTDAAPFFVFAGKTAFIEHFKYQYPEAELNDALQKALKNRRNGVLPDTIEVEALYPSGYQKFEKQYRVKVRFRVGKVPE